MIASPPAPFVDPLLPLNTTLVRHLNAIRLRERLRLTVRSLRRWPWLETLLTLRRRFRDDRLGLTASSLTFTTTMALVPLMTVMFAVFTAFPMFGSFRKALEGYLVQNLVPEVIAKPVLATLTQFALKAHRLGTLGLVLLVITAVALMLTIDRTLNAIWRVRRPRPLAQRVLIYWAVTTLGPLLLGVSVSLASYALSASRGLVNALPGGIALALDVAEFFLMVGGFAALFRFVPNTPVRWTHAFAGGLFVSIGFDLARRALAWYIGAVPSFATIYGAFATVPILLLWIYLGWVIVLLGAVIAAYAPSLEMQVVRRPPGAGQRYEAALLLLRELVDARATSQRGRSLADIAARLHMDPLQLEPQLEALVMLDWVGRLEEGGAQRLVLLVDPQQTLAGPLLDTVLLARRPATEPLWQAAALERITLAQLLAGT
jgi:membrane protein